MTLKITHYADRDEAKGRTEPMHITGTDVRLERAEMRIERLEAITNHLLGLPVDPDVVAGLDDETREAIERRAAIEEWDIATQRLLDSIDRAREAFDGGQR